VKVALLTNGPGELWGWARPVIVELRNRGHSVSLWLLPCPFASGYEREAASRLGVDKLEGPSGSAWIWHALGQEKTDCVLQLGGDLFFGRRLAGHSNVPLFCYAYGFKKGMKHARLFTAYPSMAAGIAAKLPKSKSPSVRVIGDLVKDSLALDRTAGTFKWEGGPRLLFFPGSRPLIRRMSLEWLPAIVRRLKRLIPTVQFATSFSPFTPESEFPLWADAGLNPLKAGTRVMDSADYALTQPGTNTLEMMHYGLPALVAAPMAFLKAIPVSGLVGLTSSLPRIGPTLKEWTIRKGLRRYNDFLSWPNRIADRMILDEAMGDLTPEDLADRAAESLRDEEKRAQARADLLALSGSEGAALRLCDALEEAAAKKEVYK
jgi:lipid-A-disaccharide synthase